MFNFFVAGKPAMAIEAFPSAPNQGTFLALAGINYLVFSMITIGASHILVLVILIVPVNQGFCIQIKAAVSLGASDAEPEAGQ